MRKKDTPNTFSSKNRDAQARGKISTREAAVPPPQISSEKIALQDKRPNIGEIFYCVRFFVLLVIPLILSLPLSPPRKFAINFALNTSTTTLATVDKEVVKINGSEMQLLNSTSVFSKIVGFEILPLPIKVCLNNRNKILFDGKEKRSSELPDGKEGAAMSVKIDGIKDQTPIELYAQKDKEDCKVLNLNIGDTATMQLPEIRSVLPVGQAETATENGKLILRMPVYHNASIDVEKTEIVVKTIFGWVIIRNYLIYLFGIAVLISLMEVAMRFLRWGYR